MLISRNQVDFSNKGNRCRADKNPYLHDGRADKDSYRHDRHADSHCRPNDTVWDDTHQNNQDGNYFFICLIFAWHFLRPNLSEARECVRNKPINLREHFKGSYSPFPRRILHQNLISESFRPCVVFDLSRFGPVSFRPNLVGRFGLIFNQNQNCLLVTHQNDNLSPGTIHQSTLSNCLW